MVNLELLPNPQELDVSIFVQGTMCKVKYNIEHYSETFMHWFWSNGN